MIDAAIKECLLYRRQPWGKLAIGALIVLLIVGAEIVLTAYIEMDSFELQALRAFAYQIHERMVQKPILFVLFVVTDIVIFICIVSQIVILWKSRLIVGASGIRYQSPQLSWLRVFDFSWTINWTDVDTIRIAPSFFDIIPCSTLTIDSVSQRRKISVYNWVDAEHRNETIDRTLYRRKVKLETVKRALEQQSLMKCLRALAIEVDIRMGRAAPGSSGFDLASNRHAVFALLLSAALAIYAAIEFLLLEQPVSVNMPLLGASVATGMLMAIIFTTWLRKASVPVLESAVIATSLGGASGAVLYLALRNII